MLGLFVPCKMGVMVDDLVCHQPHDLACRSVTLGMYSTPYRQVLTSGVDVDGDPYDCVILTRIETVRGHARGLQCLEDDRHPRHFPIEEVEQQGRRHIVGEGDTLVALMNPILTD